MVPIQYIFGSPSLLRKNGPRAKTPGVVRSTVCQKCIDGRLYVNIDV